MMRPDWYDFSVDVAPDSVISAVVDGLRDSGAGEGASVSETAPPRHYGKQVLIDAGPGDSPVRVAWGGQNVTPHVWASGEVAERVCAIARRRWPGGHYVSRVDACEDYRHPDAFKRLSRIMRSVARQFTVRPSVAGDWIVKEHGRTLYLGAPSSVVRVRMYEKGLQMQDRFPEHQRAMALRMYPADMVRLELQVRPASKEAKRAVGAMEAVELWGGSEWSQALISKVEGVNVPRYRPGKLWNPPDDDRAYGYQVRPQDCA